MIPNAVHVSGVGALGAFVLWELNRRGVEFTWDDIESTFNAWEVSTGSISPYPEEDQSLYARGYRFWRDVVAHVPSYQEVDPSLEETLVLYALKRPPRGRKMQSAVELGDGYQLWVDPAKGYQLNVQNFVLQTRAVFDKRRRPVGHREPEVLQLHCRGVGNVDTYALWGWQVPVTVLGQPFWPGALRPALHFADPKFPRNSFYFLPIPSYTGYWWAGSDIIMQRVPKEDGIKAQARLQEFKVWANKLFGHLLEFHYLEEQIGQGWRPIRRLHSAPMDRCVEAQPGVWVAPPLNRSGIQCGPLVAHWIADQLFGARRLPMAVQR